jgi:ppGpp synthetase/RelA/SpoT-type nucleotidyltranferase
MKKQEQIDKLVERCNKLQAQLDDQLTTIRDLQVQVAKLEKNNETRPLKAKNESSFDTF